MRSQTADGSPLWLAHAFADAGHCEPLALSNVSATGSLTSHQLKGLAVALGIWGSLRKPEMVRFASLFSSQKVSYSVTVPLADYLESTTHFGLSERAASGEWIWG